jgi:WD40 repeat protein
MTAQVFISHSSKDKQLAETLCRALEERNIACWVSYRDIEPGEDFAGAIVRAIRGCKVMVLIFSNNANSSNEITKELALASQNKLVVIPARVEDVSPSDALAYQLATSQWVDVLPPNWDDAVERIARQIRAIASAKPEALPPATSVEEVAPAAPPVEPPTIVAPPTAPAATPSIPADVKSRTGVVLWNVATGQNVRALEFPLNEVTQVAFSPDGKRIVVGGGTEGLCVSDSETGRLILSMQYSAYFLACSADGKWIVAGHPGRETVAVWDAVQGTMARQFSWGENGSPRCVAVSRDSRLLAIGFTSALLNGVVVRELASGKDVCTLQSFAGRVISLAISPDGGRIATGNHNGSVTIWDLATKRVVSTLWHAGGVTSVAFSPDGDLVAAGGFGGTVQVWNARTNQRLQTLNADASPVRDVAFSPDGRMIASGSEGGTIRLWDPATGALVRTIETPSALQSNVVGSIAFSPDGTLIAAASGIWQRVREASYGPAFLPLLVGSAALAFLYYRNGWLLPTTVAELVTWGTPAVMCGAGIFLLLQTFVLRLKG